MRFINPKIDFAFKKIFGSEHSHAILISFLNALLYDNRPMIQSLEIIDPNLAPAIQGMKDTYLDVRAKLADDRQVIIEMQVLNVAGFEKRILYNAAKTYAAQLAEGEDYTLLNPVIALTITDFIMFDRIAHWQTRFLLKETQQLMDYPLDDLALVFVELPKFHKSLEALETLGDKWLFFLQSAARLQEIPTLLGAEPSLRQAFEIANRANMSRAEIEAVERREMFWADERNRVKFAQTKGLAQGRAEGFAQGQAEGERVKARAIARAMLAQGLAQTLVAELTGLSAEELRTLTL